jgi:hypothetical protein
MTTPNTASQQQQSHPPGCYYVNLVSGTIQRQCNAALVPALAALGFVGNNGTPANPLNAFSNFQDAQNAAHLGGSISKGAGSAAGSAIGNLTGVNAIGDFFARLTEPNTWVRVGEVLAGVLLVYLGLSASVRGTEAARTAKQLKPKIRRVDKPAPKVTGVKKVAKTAVKVAPK